MKGQSRREFNKSCLAAAGAGLASYLASLLTGCGREGDEPAGVAPSDADEPVSRFEPRQRLPIGCRL